jgi:hypothetical protein
MASVFRKAHSPFWHAAYRDAHGRRRHKTTKTKKRSDAIDMAQAWDRLADAGRKRTLTEAVARRVVSELVEQSTGQPINFHTCKGWFDEWVAGKTGATAEKTIEKYQQVTRDFLQHIGDRATLPLAAITLQDVRAFRDALAKGGRSAVTVNQVVRKVLAAPFLAAMRAGYITVNPCASVEPLLDDLDGDETERGTFTPAQVRDLIKAEELLPAQRTLFCSRQSRNLRR